MELATILKDTKSRQMWSTRDVLVERFNDARDIVKNYE